MFITPSRRGNNIKPTHVLAYSTLFALTIILSFIMLSYGQDVNDADVTVNGSPSHFNPYKTLIESSLKNGFDPKSTLINSSLPTPPQSNPSTGDNTNDDDTVPPQSNTAPHPDEQEIDLEGESSDSSPAPAPAAAPDDDDDDKDDETAPTQPPREYEIQTASSSSHRLVTTFQTSTTETPPATNTNPTPTASVSIGMTAPMAAGAVGTLRVVVTNFEYEIKKGDIVSFWLPENTYSFPLISYCTATFRSQRQSTAKLGATMTATTGLGAGSSFTILCTDTKAASFQTNTGDVLALTSKFTVLDSATNTNSIREFTTFTAGSDITAPGLGSGNLPHVTLTPENKMLFAFKTPEFSIQIGNKFMIALATAWFSNPQPQCTFHKMKDEIEVDISGDESKYTAAAATAKIENSGGTDMLIVQISLPTSLEAAKNYAFWCNGFTMPLVATTVRASGGIFDDAVNNFRAFSTSFELPILRDEMAGTIFNVQLGSWTAGAITTMTASILRFPVELKKGAQISLVMPTQYKIQPDSTVDSESGTKCMLKQEIKLQSGFSTISTQAVISNNTISFVLADDQKITNYYAVTQVTCDGVLAMAAHPALSNIKLYVYPPGATSNANPLYSRLDGALSQVYPAIIGSVTLYSEQTNLVVGGSGRLVITATPQNVAILPGDEISLSLDQDYSFVPGVTVCALAVSNAATTLLNSSGDKNIPISTKVVTAANKWTTVLSVTESSASKKALLKRTDTTYAITCDGLKNPPFEKTQSPTMDMAVYHPTFGTASPKGRCSGAILPTITAAPLGLSQAHYQPSTMTLNTVTSINIIINSLTNPIPASLQGGSIAFTIPSSWTPNSSGSTTCQCNRDGCTGTTTISRALDYTVTFRPTSEIAIQDPSSGSSTVIFTCTNIRSPINPSNALNTLTITSYSASARIDTTSAGTIPAITQTTTAGSNSGTQVVHNLIFPRGTIFTPSELQVLHSAYQITFQTMGLQATGFSQKVQTAATFKVPAAFSDPNSNTGIIGMSVNMDPNFHTMGLVEAHSELNTVVVDADVNYDYSFVIDNDNDDGEVIIAQDDDNYTSAAHNQADSDIIHGCGVDNDDNDEDYTITNPVGDQSTDTDSGDENDCDCTCHEGQEAESKREEEALVAQSDNTVSTLECPCVARRRQRRLERERLLARQLAAEQGEQEGSGDDQDDNNDEAHMMTMMFQSDPDTELMTLSHAVAAQARNNNQYTHVLTTMECPCKAKARARAAAQKRQQFTMSALKPSPHTALQTFALHSTLSEAVKHHTRSYFDDENQDNVDSSSDQQDDVHSQLLPTHNSFSTLSINDVYRFSESSTVIVVGTLLSLPDTKTTQTEFVNAVNSATSRDALSQQTTQLLSTRPYYKFSGLSDEGGILPDHCLDGHFNEDDGETDVDCGGGMCNRCATGMNCYVDDDCTSKKCKDKRCASGAGMATLTFSALMVIIGMMLW